MATAWAELAGSPAEEIGKDGMRAQRRILCDWDNRGEVRREFLATGFLFGGQARGTQYPDAPGLSVVTIRAEAFHDDVLPQEFESAAKSLNRYRSYAMLTIDYDYVKPLKDPQPPEGFFTYRWSPALETQPISDRSLRFVSDTLPPTQADLTQTLRVPIIEHVLSWHAVKKVPVEAIRLTLGSVNDDEFLGAPAETLLFDSCNTETEFVLPFEFNDPKQTYRVDYIFREKAILSAAGVRVATWGWIFRNAPTPGWAEVQLADGTRLFQFRAFERLLTPESDVEIHPKWIASIVKGDLF